MNLKVIRKLGDWLQRQDWRKRTAWARQFCLYIATCFKRVVDPALSKRARIGALCKGLAALGGAMLGLLLAYALLLIPFTPGISDLRKAKIDQPAVLLSADGKELATFKRNNREWVELNEISPYVVKALIATEDHRFYEHHGLDFKRTASSIVHTLRGNPQGGSTLTQQLARNLYPEEIGRERSINRKIKELITALKIELTYTKDEILVTYLNTMPFLYNAFGIEMGARTYFDKPAAKLNVLESATLIGMLKGTSYYNPVLNPERAQHRRNVVLSQMLKRGVLGQAEFDKLKNRPLRLDFERQEAPQGIAPHFAEYARKWLIDWADRNDYNIYADGLVVRTTIDSRLQAAANQAVQRQLNALQAVADVEWALPSDRLISSSPYAYVGMQRRVKPFSHFWNSKGAITDAFVRESIAYRRVVNAGMTADEALTRLKKDGAFMDKLRAEKTRLQAGLVALDPSSGEIRAWVGSRDYEADQFDHVAQARRQPGSTFKPIVYGAALENGMAKDQRFADKEVEIAMKDGTVWRPTDMSGPSGRMMSIRQGLMYSKNTITAQVMQEIGPRKTIALARKMGIRQSELESLPALALGVSPVTLLEMVSAYGTIAASGEYRAPVFVASIEDKQGRLLASFTSKPSRAMSRETAEELIDMLRGAVRQGTGRGLISRFGVVADVAGKTGTTQNNTDGWFILMHPRLVTGTWVGFNDARVTMRSDYWGQGGHNALLVVGDFFRHAASSRLIDVRAQFPQPDDGMFGPLLRHIDELLGRKRPAPAPSAPADPEEEPSKDTPLDEVERIIRQAHDVAQTVEREQRRIEKAVEMPMKALNDLQREIAAQGGNRAEPLPRGQAEDKAHTRDTETTSGTVTNQ
ncbi:penicillin-binding protein 1A [Paucimonas lemoignei]|uniref:Penicillin-binding protein 1A n=1 Tax=Paucimonas lemoignei TaxID=29443 RepID=A0A4R3HUP1_PAULE|nr:transglycosylase domain-containing protein [Paucimonas lemoignei]TCS36947.1 penicillin-binding protein 1A [Paucimonas lemoignei]